MSKLSLEIEQLQKALERLKEVLAAEPTQFNKDATLQRFEFTFELLWKTLKTYIEETGRNAMPTSPRDVFRVAADLQVISDPQPYFDFLEKRNLSSHVYSESQADTIYKVVKDFPTAVESVLKKMYQQQKEHQLPT